MQRNTRATATAPWPLERLRERLRGLDGRSYRAYRVIAGAYQAHGFVLRIEHVQGDPFAEPSRLCARVPEATARLPAWTYSTPTRRTATADFLNRRLHRALAERSSVLGSGKSGELRVLRPGQQVLARTSVSVDDRGAVEARFRAGLPARGRRILGRQAADLLTRAVVASVEHGLLFAALDEGALRVHIETVEDARALRAQLAGRGLVAFLADGAVLPRRSGVDDRPLAPDRACAFRAPRERRVTLNTPNAGPVTGLGIPAGVTLIVGGGYHGKSTLLQAIARGVYDHVPGDGRERVVTIADAVTVQAESGRSVAGTDISNFIDRLPGGTDTRRFTTPNASGSTSQAAAIIEALEVGARALLLDEDTSATNFLIRDARMQALVGHAFEPITPLIDRVRQLADKGVSTVMVVGGSGDYFDVADAVIAMRDYQPSDVTAQARSIAADHPTARRAEGGSWRPIAPRAPLPASLDPGRGRRAVAIRTWTEDRLMFGAEEVDLSAVSQIVERAQVRAMAWALTAALGDAIDGRRAMAEAIERVTELIRRRGLGAVDQESSGEMAVFRRFELAALIGRLRMLQTADADAAGGSVLKS